MIIRFKLSDIKLSSAKMKVLIKEKVRTQEMEDYINKMVEDTMKALEDLASKPKDSIPEWARSVSVEITPPKPASVGYPIYESEDLT